MKGFLIDAKDVVENTPVRGSVDPEYISVVIRRVQDTESVYVLGTKLQEKLIKISDGDENDHPDGRYKKLIETYVQPYMWWRVAHGLLFNVAVKIASGGVVEGNSEQGNAVFSGTMAIIRQDILNASDAYKKLLIRYLCYNNNKYPEYTQYEPDKPNRQDNGRPFRNIEFY
jgi:hypothetical protein